MFPQRLAARRMGVGTMRVLFGALVDALLQGGRESDADGLEDLAA